MVECRLVTLGRRTRPHGALGVNKACWFLLILPNHREIRDRDIAFYVQACTPTPCIPQNRNGRKTKGERSARQCVCGRHHKLTVFLLTVKP